MLNPTSSATWSLALSGARAHRAALSGTALVFAAAGAVVSMVGVLMESGLRTGAGALTALASSFAGTALVVVVIVVAATVTLTLRGRRRELALMRTVGATSRQVRQLVSREVLLVALVAVPLGAVPGLLLARPLQPLLRDAGVVAVGGGLTLSPLPVLVAVALLLPVALLAGRLATRETLRSAPTDAVRSSQVESLTIGSIRRLLAAVTAVAGLAAAFTPLVVPGTIGGATAATSAFLLIGAAALAGPLLVGWAFGRTARLGGNRGSVARRLALVNVRGFSHRLTAVIVPLALALATGTIQTSVDRAINQAAHEQLGAAVGADLVATGPALSSSELARVTSAPGVTGVVPIADVPVQVRTDQEDLPDSLVWETTSLRAVPPGAPVATFNPDVTAGSLGALTTAGTVAVSSDTAFELGLGVGDSVDLRYADEEHQTRVVAVFSRGLGVGDLLTGPLTVADLGAEAVSGTLLVETAGADPATAAAALREAGLTVATAEEYVAASTSSDAAGQRLSSVLLLLLLVFVGLGAANTLVLTTAGRRAELALLHRTGTTRRQLLAMTATESLLTALAAWAIGTLAVVPAVLGVTFGLLGPAVPVLDLTTYGLLTGAVLVTAVGTTMATAVRTVRRATVAGS